MNEQRFMSQLPSFGPSNKRRVSASYCGVRQHKSRNVSKEPQASTCIPYSPNPPQNELDTNREKAQKRKVAACLPAKPDPSASPRSGMPTPTHSPMPATHVSAKWRLADCCCCIPRQRKIPKSQGSQTTCGRTACLLGHSPPHPIVSHRDSQKCPKS